MGATVLLDRLERVRQTGPGRWIARCPAHEDRSPSLSIRELDDGRVLLYDFGGCEIGDVLSAVGLALRDLFPCRLPGHGYASTHSRVPARDLLEVISEDTSVVALIAAAIMERGQITTNEWRSLAAATARIGRVRDYAYAR